MSVCGVETALVACLKCEREKPFTKEFFRCDSRFGSGIYRYCLECIREENKIRSRRIRAEHKARGIPLVTLLEKKCSTCKEVLPSTDFFPARHNKDYLDHRCKDCSLGFRYGLTGKHYRELLDKPCAICGDKSEVLDHNHSSKRNREGLCSKCNKILGFARDSGDILIQAAEYLGRHND